jgi:alkylation response protein AidB-like acyl-CoA dehydrogenase
MPPPAWIRAIEGAGPTLPGVHRAAVRAGRTQGDEMFEWSEEQLMIRDAVRQFVEAEIAPRREELEHGDLPPYDLLRKLFSTFGMDQMARAGFESRIAREKRIAAGEEEPKAAAGSGSGDGEGGGAAAAGMTMIPIIEICRYCPGMVTAMGVSMGLTSASIMSRGTIAQKERWAVDLLTLDKIGAWAITEPGSGSDAFGSMKSTARRDGDEYLLNGSKTFITNGPFADTIVFICKLDEGNPPAERKVLSFILDKGMPGLVQSKPLRKMGMHSSPTGELFLDDVRVGRDRLIGETEDVPSGGREGAKDTFSMERSGVAAMSLGIIDKCLELCVQYAKDRVQFGQPIGEFQLIQEKLAKMEVARLNVQNLVFRFLEMGAAGATLSLAEASAMKLYSARAAVEVAMEAVQLHGGNGYMAEFHVEQLARDSKVLQIYAGTDEIQITHIAKDLLRR